MQHPWIYLHGCTNYDGMFVCVTIERYPAVSATLWAEMGRGMVYTKQGEAALFAQGQTNASETCCFSTKTVPKSGLARQTASRQVATKDRSQLQHTGNMLPTESLAWVEALLGTQGSPAVDVRLDPQAV